MFYDLNIPWSPSVNDSQLPRTLAFLHELGYNTIALNHTRTGKLPAVLDCPIPDPLPFTSIPPNLTIFRRCTLVLTDSHSNARLAELSKNYDIFAVRPIDERTLSLACTSLDCDIISLDLTQRLPFWFKHRMLSEAVKSGKKFEISYAQGIQGDGTTRRNLISNATQLIRASRGRGLVISSEARTGVELRGPWDAINLAAVWGLGQERGHEAMSKECRSLVVNARLKRTGYRGVVDVVYGGEKPVLPPREESGKGKLPVKGQKRKAEVMEAANGGSEGVEKPLSKRQMKKQQNAMRDKLQECSMPWRTEGRTSSQRSIIVGIKTRLRTTMDECRICSHFAFKTAVRGYPIYSLYSLSQCTPPNAFDHSS